MTVVGRVDRGSSRFYADPVSGRLFDSVTTVISATNSKPYLVDWSAKLAAEFAVDHHDLVGTNLREAGRDAAVDLVKGAARRRREEAADRGTASHAAIEALLLDQSIPQTDNPATQAEVDAVVDGFLNFVTDHDPVIELAEATVANVEHGYAGTLDSAMLLPKLGRFGLIDVKSGANLDATIAAQLAAYGHPDNELWLDDIGTKAPMPKVDAHYVLHLRPEYARGYKLLEVDVTGAFAWFADMCRVYRAAQDRAKLGCRVIYPPLPDGSQPLPLLEDIDGWTKARNALIGHGYTTLAELAQCTSADLLALRGVGKACVAQVGEMLAHYGLALYASVPAAREAVA